MKRIKVLLFGVGLGVVYAFLTMLIVHYSHNTVSFAYIFSLPLILGAIPVILSTKAQLKSYLIYLIVPWVSVLTFFWLSFLSAFEGLICLVIIVGPFLIIGSLGAFIYRLIKLKSTGDNSNRLYISLFIPLVVLGIESLITPQDYYGTVSSSMRIYSDKQTVWENIKNVKSINENEIKPHFIHQIGIPKPINGELEFEGIGATRSITWEKGLKFREEIVNWNEGNGFEYNIVVNPDDIPPNTLDEHVMIGGQYFDAIKGSYTLKQINKSTQELTLTTTYRITSTVNFYGKYWTNFIFEDFHQMILEVIKGRCENTDKRR